MTERSTSRREMVDAVVYRQALFDRNRWRDEALRLRGILDQVGIAAPTPDAVLERQIEILLNDALGG